MLRFIQEAQSLCVEVKALINSSMVVLSPKIPVAQYLMQILYVVQDDELREKGINDCKQLIKRTNVFINHHRMVVHVSVALEPLQIDVSTTKQQIQRFVSLGLPSPFSVDGLVLRIEQLSSQIEHMQQDRSFTQNLNDPISIEDME